MLDSAVTTPIAAGGAGGGLEADARLGDGLVPPPGAVPSRPAEILLTGVTGFLGGEIAAALLHSTTARLHCVVRGRPDRPAGERLDRIRRKLDVDPARLVLVDGDLADGALAFDRALAHRIDTVVHCAAAVNLFAPYAELRSANVLGARAVLELAARGAPKAIHFVSTVGVFLSPHYRGCTVYEDRPVEGAAGLRNGYASSKWAADTMMARARARGFGVTVYRPAFVGWHSRTGRAGEHDIVALLLMASSQAGCAPRLDLQINSTPVDHVAEAVAGVISTPSAHGGTYHVVNRAAARFVDLAAAAGLPIIHLEEWQGMVAERAPAFAKVAGLLRRSQTDPASGADELRFEHNRTYDDARLRSALAASYRASRPLGADALARFAAGLKKS